MQLFHWRRSIDVCYIVFGSRPSFAITEQHHFGRLGLFSEKVVKYVVASPILFNSFVCYRREIISFIAKFLINKKGLEIIPCDSNMCFVGLQTLNYLITCSRVVFSMFLTSVLFLMFTRKAITYGDNQINMKLFIAFKLMFIDPLIRLL